MDEFKVWKAFKSAEVDKRISTVLDLEECKIVYVDVDNNKDAIDIIFENDYHQYAIHLTRAQLERIQTILFNNIKAIKYDYNTGEPIKIEKN